MYLKLLGWRQGYKSEISWVKIFSINRPPGGVNAKEPFVYLRSLTKSDLLKNFFYDEQRTIRNIMLWNLLASLVELRETALNPKECEAIKEGSNQFHAEVTPVWCIMGTSQFQTSTLELFGDSQAVYNYVFPKKEVAIQEFWSLWKLWKKICMRYWNRGLRFGPMIEYMTLPGEPMNQ